MTESAKRTIERNGVIAGAFQPYASRTEKSTPVGPSASALGQRWWDNLKPAKWAA